MKKSALILVVLLVIIAIFFLWRSGTTQAPEQSTSPTPTTSLLW